MLQSMYASTLADSNRNNSKNIREDESIYTPLHAANSIEMSL